MEKFQPVGNIDDLEIVESTPLFDAKLYDGKRVKIATVRQDWQDSHYIDGKFVADKTIKTPVIIIETEPVATINAMDGPKEIRATARFSLQEMNGKVVISKHPKAKLWKFLRKMGASKPSELVGKSVTLTAEPSTDENDDRLWLRIVC